MKSPDQSHRTGTQSASVITSIEPLNSDPNLRRIKIGRKTVATLRSGDVERLKLQVDQPWTTKRARQVMEAAAVQKARVDARRILARRMLSVGETRDRLARKCHETSIIDAVVQELVADGWIDEVAYGRAVIDSVQRKRPAGSKLLKEKLRSRKIQDEAILEAVSGSDSNKDVEAAFGFAKRQWAKLEELPRPKAIRRLAGLLTRRGYEEQTVADVLQRLGIE